MADEKPISAWRAAMMDSNDWDNDPPRNVPEKYPKLGVVIAVFQRHKPQILLIKRQKEPYAGMWALPGGGVEHGERLYVAAQRELREETRLRGIPLQLAGHMEYIEGAWHRVHFLFEGETEQEYIYADSDALAADWWDVDVALSRAEVTEYAKSCLRKIMESW